MQITLSHNQPLNPPPSFYASHFLRLPLQNKTVFKLFKCHSLIIIAVMAPNNASHFWSRLKNKVMAQNLERQIVSLVCARSAREKAPP